MADAIGHDEQHRTPVAGDLTPGWRLATALTWTGVILALAGVWNVSDQLGLSTWWLGPRGDPRPLVVQVSPFIAPVLMVLGALNRVRWLAWWGIGASAVIAAVGVGDLRKVGSIAAVELLIALVAALVSLASLTGTYRRAR